MDTIQSRNDFLQLIEQNKAIIFKICNAYCSNAHEREDLAQEIIYQLWKSGRHFNTGYIFSTWMYRVALNVAISFYRKEKRMVAGIVLNENELNIADTTGSNAQLEENIQRLQQLIHAMKDLDRALMLLYLESKSYNEIAEILGISETNVATKISRIKEKLRQHFANLNTR